MAAFPLAAATMRVGNFVWNHDPPRDEFVVTTPLGAEVAEIPARVTRRVEVRTADGRADSASDWASLTERVVGFPVPVDGLAFWARGRRDRKRRRRPKSML